MKNIRTILESCGLKRTPLNDWTAKNGEVQFEAWYGGDTGLQALLGIGKNPNEFYTEAYIYSLSVANTEAFNKWNQSEICLKDFRYHNPKNLEKSINHLIKSKDSGFYWDFEEEFSYWPSDDREEKEQMIDIENIHQDIKECADIIYVNPNGSGNITLEACKDNKKVIKRFKNSGKIKISRDADREGHYSDAKKLADFISKYCNGNTVFIGNGLTNWTCKLLEKTLSNFSKKENKNEFYKAWSLIIMAKHIDQHSFTTLLTKEHRLVKFAIKNKYTYEQCVNSELA